MPVLLAYPSSTAKLSAHQNFSPGATLTPQNEGWQVSVPVDPKDLTVWTLERGDTDYARFVVRSNVDIQFTLVSADVYRLSHDADGRITYITFPYPFTDTTPPTPEGGGGQKLVTRCSRSRLYSSRSRLYSRSGVYVKNVNPRSPWISHIQLGCKSGSRHEPVIIGSRDPTL